MLPLNGKTPTIMLLLELSFLCMNNLELFELFLCGLGIIIFMSFVVTLNPASALKRKGRKINILLARQYNLKIKETG